jgi:hypothetical protein
MHEDEGGLDGPEGRRRRPVEHLYPHSFGPLDATPVDHGVRA